MGWKEVKVGDLGKIVTGKTPSKDLPEEWGNEVLFLTPTDYGNCHKYANDTLRKLSSIGKFNHKQRLLPKNSIMVTCIGSGMGKTLISRCDTITNQQINSIIIDEKIYNVNFTYYLFKNIENEIKQLGGDGSAVPILNKSDFSNITIEVPTMPEQCAIATVLSSLDDKIDLLHRQNTTLEAMAEALFRQWFVVEAKKEWEEKTIGDVVEIKGGSTPSTKNLTYWDGNISWTSPKDLTNKKSIFLSSTERTISASGLAQISSGLLPKGTLLLSSRAPIGYLAITDIELAINQGYIAILNNNHVSNYYMYLWCKYNMDEIKAAGNGSVFQEISKSLFRQLHFLLPSEGILSDFNIIITSYFSKIRSNQVQIQTLEKLRDTLLPKLMSGEVRVDF